MPFAVFCINNVHRLNELQPSEPYMFLEPEFQVFGDAKSGVGTDAPVFKLFGKKVVLKDSYEHHPQSGRDLRIGASPAIVAAGGSSWNPWPGTVQQLMCFVPQPDGFAAQSVVPWFAYNGGLPCALFYPQAAPPAQHQRQHHQTSAPRDQKRTQREGSLTGSNTASSAVPAASAAAQNSDAAESHGPGQENTGKSDAVPPAAAAVHVPRLARCASSASFSRRGFVPYKRCAAESEARAPRPVAAGEEADGELTRLCL